VDDAVIAGKVKVAIFNEPTLKSAEINVETFKGVVQLSGFVTSQVAESKAVEVVPGRRQREIGQERHALKEADSRGYERFGASAS
jgi:hypothetical protein